MPEYVPDQRIKEFCEKNVMHVFQQLITRTYRLPEVQARYVSNCTEIVQRYGSVLHVALNDTAPSVGTQERVPIMGYRLINESVPEITIFLRSIRELFDDEKATGLLDFRQVFERRVVIGYMHELDHLAKGLVGSIQDPIDTQLRNESVAQGETCEYTIRPMVEVHPLRISLDMQVRYSQWIKAGRNVQSPIWTSYISSIYRQMLEERR